MRIPCVKDCPDRSGTCHAVCEKYLAYSKFCEERRKHNRKDEHVWNYIKDSVEASRKGKR